MCRQIAELLERQQRLIVGTQGNCEITSFNGKHVITGPNAWKWKPKDGENDMYQQELDELFAAIRKGEPKNDGVWMTHSTLAAILGRMAAYTGQTITWEQALASQETLLPAKLDPNAPPAARRRDPRPDEVRVKPTPTSSLARVGTREPPRVPRDDGRRAAAASAAAAPAQDSRPRIKKALKYGMIAGNLSVMEKFRIAKRAGLRRRGDRQPVAT